MKWFKCQCCEEIIEGKPDTRISMFLGFAWTGEIPNQTLDLCQQCAYMVLKKYREARNLRLAEVYQKRLEAWNLEKLNNIKERSIKKCRDHQQRSSGLLARVLHVSQKRQKEKALAQIVELKSGQMVHSFSN